MNEHFCTYLPILYLLFLDGDFCLQMSFKRVKYKSSILVLAGVANVNNEAISRPIRTPQKCTRATSE